MLRPGFGLKDAPRAWAMEFGNTMKANSFYPTAIDPHLYNKHDGSGRLLGQLSDHVDDVKGTMEPETTKVLINDLTRRDGALKFAEGDFEHVGIMHKRMSDGRYRLDQNHYVEQLRSIGLEDAEKKRRTSNRRLQKSS